MDGIKRFLDLLEAAGEQPQETMSSSQIAAVLKEELQDIVADFQASAGQDSQVPGGPDTSKFREFVSGQIVFAKNFVVSGGQYGFDTKYWIGIKVGSGTKPGTFGAINFEVRKVIAALGGSNGTIKSSDGRSFSIRTSEGTAYSVIGFSVT